MRRPSLLALIISATARVFLRKYEALGRRKACKGSSAHFKCQIPDKSLCDSSQITPLTEERASCSFINEDLLPSWFIYQLESEFLRCFLFGGSRSICQLTICLLFLLLSDCLTSMVLSHRLSSIPGIGTSGTPVLNQKTHRYPVSKLE